MRVIAGKAKGQKIVSQKNLGARPTTGRVRSSLFSILESSGLHGKRVIDLYAGTGTLGIEALSRGASWVDFVESNAKRCGLLRRSLANMGFSTQSKVHCMKVEKALTSIDNSYDIILMDPPYSLGPIHDILNAVSLIAEPGAILAAGHSKRHGLEDEYQGFKLIKESRQGDTICSIYREDQFIDNRTIPR
ncbi:16S rRNA (guanine(966)-N(2))-methyltransferase RsmD [Dehalococcoidia bacterium]|nr:16S rRNA (guanine(966)-N(2))-methyltransferase RsmD [Dehalococcoidia bacterium]